MNQPRVIWAWALYDWANSAFTTLVVTFVYSTYFTKAMAPDEVTGTTWWSRAVVVSALLTSLLSPILGAAADRAGTFPIDSLTALRDSGLMGLLVPGLARAREQAKAAVCSSNLRQLALANTLYAQDFGAFVAGAAEVTNGGDGPISVARTTARVGIAPVHSTAVILRHRPLFLVATLCPRHPRARRHPPPRHRPVYPGGSLPSIRLPWPPSCNAVSLVSMR